MKDTKHNFGFVKRGEVIRNTFELKNNGNQPLIFNSAEIACSCTTVELPKHPVLPGQKDSVIVIFNTTTVYGRQDRFVLIHSNAANTPIKLRYKGIVSQK